MQLDPQFDLANDPAKSEGVSSLDYDFLVLMIIKDHLGKKMVEKLHKMQ